MDNEAVKKMANRLDYMRRREKKLAYANRYNKEVREGKRIVKHYDTE